MLTACRYRNQSSKTVILSIGSRLKGNSFDLPVPCEIGRGFEPSSFMFLRGTFAFGRRERSGDGPKFRIHQTDCRSGIAQNSCRARFDAHSQRNGKFESTSLQRRESANFRSLARCRNAHLTEYRSAKLRVYLLTGPKVDCDRRDGQQKDRKTTGLELICRRISRGSKLSDGSFGCREDFHRKLKKQS